MNQERKSIIDFVLIVKQLGPFYSIQSTDTVNEIECQIFALYACTALKSDLYCSYFLFKILSDWQTHRTISNDFTTWTIFKQSSKAMENWSKAKNDPCYEDMFKWPQNSRKNHLKWHTAFHIKFMDYISHQFTLHLFLNAVSGQEIWSKVFCTMQSIKNKKWEKYNSHQREGVDVRICIYFLME